MKRILIFLVVLLPYLAKSQTVITGKYKYMDSLTFAKYKNTYGDSLLTTDALGRLKMVKNSAADTVSLSDRINARVKYTDTASMLIPYLRKLDTTGKWLAVGYLPYLVKYTDTAAFLSAYYNKTAIDAKLALKLNISDTATMLSPYARTITLGGYIPYTGATSAIDLNAKTVVNISHLGINTATVPTILLRAIGDNNSSSRIAMRGYSSDANSSSIRVTKFRGTAASPQAPLSGDGLGKFELAGYGTTSSDGYPQASFEGIATENWGATARGAKVQIKITPNTTITQAIALTINQDKSAVFENSITGTSLIKTGGTSLQFLKADGSVDANSYMNISDTATMLNPYLRSTSYGLTKSSQTVSADSSLLSTKLWRQKGIDSVSANVNLKVNISDTATMLSKYYNKTAADAKYALDVKYTDTGTMLSPYYRTATATAALATKVNISDTSTMLSPYQRSFSAVKYTDTATMLSGYKTYYPRTAVSLTVTGSSGASSYSNSTGVLNVPTYTLSGLGGEPAITAGTTSQYWRGDKTWQTLDKTAVGLSNVTNNAQVTSVTGTSPIASSGGTTPAISITQANTTTSGYLSFGDWNTFNGKQAALNGTGFVKATGTIISYDNSTYITGNQTITLSGDISGSGATAITTTIGLLKVTNGMLAGTINYSKMDATTVPTWNQSTTGTAANITATSNATLTTLSALSLPYSQLTGTPTLSYLPLAGGTLTGGLNGTYSIFTNTGWASTASDASKYTNWSVGATADYIQSVILLHPIYNGTLINYNLCSGKIYQTRGNSASGSIIDVYDINTQSAYNGIAGELESLGYAGQLVTCTYGGVLYMALLPYYHTSSVSFTFDGYIKSQIPSNQLLIVPYRNSSTGVILNSEINSSITAYSTNMSKTFTNSFTTFSIPALSANTYVSNVNFTDGSSNTGHFGIIRNSTSGNGAFFGADGIVELYTNMSGTNVKALSLATTGAASFTTSASSAFILNSTNANAGYLTFQKSGTDYGYIGNAYHLLTPSGANTDLAISSPGAVIIGTGAALPPRLTISSTGNVGVGTTPQGWYSSYKTLEVGNASLYSTSATTSYVGNNFYVSGAGVATYNTTGIASVSGIESGDFVYYNSISGTAGTTVSFIERLRISSSSATFANSLNVGGTGIFSNYVKAIAPNLSTPAYYGYPAALTSSANDYSLGTYFLNGVGSNNSYIESGTLRTSAGSDWTTSGYRIQQVIDGTYMGYLQFNGTNRQGGFSIGTGLTASRQTVAERFYINSGGSAFFNGAVTHYSTTTLGGNITYDPGDQVDWYLKGAANGPTIRMRYSGGTGNRNAALGWMSNTPTYNDVLGWDNGSATSYVSFGVTMSNPSITFTDNTSSRIGIVGITDNYNLYVTSPSAGNLYLGNYTTSYVRGDLNVSGSAVYSTGVTYGGVTTQSYGYGHIYKGYTGSAYDVMFINPGNAVDELQVMGGLNMTTTTAGFTVPNMTTTQKNALTKRKGMIVYDTTINLLQAWNGSAWNNLW
ncbi:hypothetical protein UFOVP153_61 [uncultured Caudovirales phage]|uniref:Uncharacterized protein n=1 Tax=uncultured Caudovirales phage TaxID=2100421 RepID=A0A6J5KY89_9CAUD|nr:hypothetical protein UFOVP69_62 [uncultured Caudovirales phage]CAB5171103.1 hypothetical protein UFOVP153_61 [uncultured Caudovirales phage]